MVVDVIWPHVTARLGGHLIAADQEWDTDAGVDFMWARGIRRNTVATRVQKCDQAWDTFTIRTRTQYGRPTEWEKRHTAVMADSLRPDYTLQGYVTPDGRFLSAALVLSDDLYRIAYAGRFVRPERRNVDGSRFRVIDWSELPPDQIWLFR
jgi:hypothetical protein